MVMLHNGPDAPSNGGGMEEVRKPEENDERESNEDNLLTADSSAEEQHCLLHTGENAPGTFLKQEQNEPIENHAERNGCDEWEETMALVERLHKDNERQPDNEPAGHKPGRNAQEEREACHLAEPPRCIAADKDYLTECEIEDPEHSIDQSQPRRYESSE